MIRVFKRELSLIWHNPRYVILLTLGVVLAFTFFATLTREGMPEKLPVAVVDMDHTYLSRRLCHELEATQGVSVVAVYDNHTQARQAIQRGEIFAFYEIPKGTYNELLQFHAPHFGLYTNTSYLLAGMLSYKQLATMGMLAAGAVQREVFRKKGYDEEKVMGLIMPVEFDTHLVGNPLSSYKIYLMTTLIPALISFIALQHSIYVLVREREKRTVRNLMRKAKGNRLHAFMGKLLPYTILYSLLLLIANLLMFGPMHFPFEGSWLMMMANSVMLIAAVQCAAVLIVSLVPEIALGIGAVYGALCFSLSGFSFPIEAMPRAFTGISWLYPIRHYYLNYCDIAIFGNGLEHTWPHFVALLAFGLAGLAGVWAGRHYTEDPVEDEGFKSMQPPTGSIKSRLSILVDIWDVFTAEIRRVFSNKMVMLAFFVATVLYPVVFCLIYSTEYMHNMPVAVVDESHCEASKRFAHKIDATPEVDVHYRCNTLAEAQQLMRDHKIHAIYYIPADFSEKIAEMRTARIGVFCDMSSFYYYKSAATGGSFVLIDEMHTIELERMGMAGTTGQQAVDMMQPAVYDDIRMYNPSGGFASFFVPALLILVIHQSLFFGITILCGESNENKKALRLIPARLRSRSIHRVTVGRTLCFLMLYVPITLMDLWIIPRLFGLPQLGNLHDILLFILPLLIAVVSMGLTIGNFFVREQLSGLLGLLWFSVLLFFMSGIVWPHSNMPTFWNALSYLFPSTPGIQGFVGITSMGATLAEVRQHYLTLWIQAGAWFTAACLSLRFIKKFRKP